MQTKWLLSWLWIVVGFAQALAAAAEKPNVLWITGEDMSAKWLGCYQSRLE